MESENPFPTRKMLTSRTGSTSHCYYTPHPDGQHLVYKWTTNGASKDVKWYACAGCKSAKNKDKTLPKVPNAKQDKETERWIVNPLDLNSGHYCEPLEASKEKANQIIFERKKDITKNGGSVIGHMRKATLAITERYGSRENVRLSIEHHALGRPNNARKQLQRAKKRRYPVIDDITDIDHPAKKLKLEEYTLSILGVLTHSDDKLIRFYNPKFVIFISGIQIKWFKWAKEIFGDGTFKFAAHGYQQIYRLYGLFKDTQCSPLVTILTKFKDQATYIEAFQKVLEIVGVAVHELRWKVAHFDQEKAAVNAFIYVFGTRVEDVKVCAFHSKQGLIRNVGSLHVKTVYNVNRKFKKFIQRLGAIQLIDPAYLDIAKIYLLEEADDLGNDETLPDGIVEIARTLVEDYYKNWVDTSLGREFFSLYNIKTNRTINYAESYHGKQKTTFGEAHLPLGTWIFHQRETQHYDDEKLNRVMKKYDNPPPPNEDIVELDDNIDEAKNQMDIFMEDPDYEQKQIFLYYSLKLGKLLGFKKTL